MSTTIARGYGVTVTRFYGGRERGCMVEVYDNVRKVVVQTRKATEREKNAPAVYEPTFCGEINVVTREVCCYASTHDDGCSWVD